MLFAIIFVLSAISARKEGEKSLYVKTKEGRRACIEGGIFLRVPFPKKGGIDFVAEKYTGDKTNSQKIAKYNPKPKKGKLSEVRIPIEILLPVYKIEAITALFPEDKRIEGGWLHKYDGEGLWAVAKWFCGSSKKIGEIKKELKGKEPKKGETFLIPDKILSDTFFSIPVPKDLQKEAKKEEESKKAPPDSQKQEASAPPFEELSVEEARKLISYGKDEKGDYAVYHLAQGEALYSSVVVRFTGRLFAAEVNSLAMEIAERSGIKDVTSIPIGYEIKIPLEMLLPQFYPEDSQVYKDWRSHQQELATIINTYKNASLEGVVVILDPGHGGLDRGAIKNNVWEDSYVYDIACRIREGLETKTKAKVFMTLMEPSKGFKPIEKPGLTPNKKSTILTHPSFQPDSSDETKAAVNMRWIFANYHYKNLIKEGVSPERIVFTSIHADSLHPSLRGTMFYIPGSNYREQKWGVKGDFFLKFQEAKSVNQFSLTKKEMERSEGLSMQFAKTLEKSFKKNNLKLHPYQPTRDHVVRNRKAWVPAVLKYNLIPCNILIEVCNLNNKEDAELMKDPVFRQKIANAYIEALIMYYS
ncbi:MAG: N-acetylmuramoyl-L-alanine amidase [Acidobacteria bacterium]|nr:N-acetylmuramoyl-L-alanine amidase [Acidobacteriota bacterium]